MQCQCRQLEILRKDETKLAEMLEKLETCTKLNSGELTTELRNAAIDTKNAVKPSNIGSLKKSVELLNKSMSFSLKLMLKSCKEKKTQLSQSITSLKLEDNSWHTSQHR